MIIIEEFKDRIIKEVFNNYFKNKELSIKNNQIILNEDYSFLDGNNSCRLEFKKYVIKYRKSFDTFNIYIYENDRGFLDYKIYQNSPFILAISNDANIISKDKYLANYYLLYKNGILETNYDNLLLNNKLYHGEKLKNKDRIDFISFSFIYFDQFFYMSNYLVTNKLKIAKLNEMVVKYDKTKPMLSNYYEKKIEELQIDKLERFKAPKLNNKRKLIYQMGPTLTMSLAMIFVAAINIYNSYLNNATLLSMLGLIMMPFTMLLSGVMWPLLSKTDEKRTYKREYQEVKDQYLNYLKNYEKKINLIIRKYLDGLKEYEFDTVEIKNKLFYLTNKSTYFLSINLGFEVLSYPIEVEETNDKEIDEYLNRIKYYLNNINDCPLLLDLKSNKRISIFTSNKEYYLNRILLELCYKYHYLDLNIAIFSKEEEIFKGKEYLPHTFNGEERLFLDNERDLRNLNYLNNKKPLVVLMNDYSDATFDNENIILIFFTDKREQILKNSDAIVEFKDKGLLYNEGLKEFKYQNEIIDFNYYYRYIALFLNNEQDHKYEFFRDLFPGLDIEKYYSTRPYGLKAEFAYINNEILSFDLHETKDGPHGLIGGSTGSGKSELIVSLLLSLAIKYPPNYLNIILIDYKGGGIKESLSYQNDLIPHVTASINNLEEGNFERLMVAIQRECKSRQNAFSRLANLAETSIMNLDEYLDLYAEFGLKKIPHLLIVVDEFAQLKKENPYLIKELVSISRIGRSLGLHLILATQKPGGVIDEEIFSNAHFKIALKLMNEKDSLDIIKSKDAAYLKSPGEFYLNVDDNLIKAKSLYSKKDIDGKDAYEAALLDLKLNVVSKRIKKNTDICLESEYLVEKIIETSKKLKIKNNFFSFEKPHSLKIRELKQKYQVNDLLILGEIDDYLNAQKDILAYNFEENLLIYSSRSKEIINILNQLNSEKKPSIVIASSYYLGSYIRDSLLYEDEEDVMFLFTKLLSDKETMLNIIIEDLNTFLSYNENYQELLFKLIRRSAASNFTFYILSKNSNINFKLLNSIKEKIAINIYDKQDIINLYSTKGNYAGSAYFFNEVPITFIPAEIEEYEFNEPRLKNYLEKIPDNVELVETQDGVLIGYDLKSRDKVIIKQHEKLLITSFNSSLLEIFAKKLIKYTNINVATYSNELIQNNYEEVLWLGENIYSQRIFYVDSYEPLKNNEAYLYRNNRLKKIRTINYE